MEKANYHPRISAQYTYIYRSLNDYERWCFNRLYNDFFYHRHNDSGRGKAMWKMPPLINATDMLVFAEDLGMIPDCVPAEMQQLEILSLKSSACPRIPKPPSATPGTIRTTRYAQPPPTTWAAYANGGEEDRDATQRFYNEVLHEGGAAPYFAEPGMRPRSRPPLMSPSMLCILPLQD